MGGWVVCGPTGMDSIQLDAAPRFLLTRRGGWGGWMLELGVPLDKEEEMPSAGMRSHAQGPVRCVVWVQRAMGQAAQQQAKGSVSSQPSR